MPHLDKNALFIIESLTFGMYDIVRYYQERAEAFE